MVYAQTRNCPENEAHKILGDFEIQTDYLISAWRRDLEIVNKKKKKRKKRNFQIVYFAVPANHRVKIKENEKRDKYLDLARELKKLWHMRVTVIPIVISTLGTIPKGLISGLEE